ALVGDLLLALKGALLDTMRAAAAPENLTPATDSAPAKLVIDKAKLREIIELTVAVARRCLRYEPLLKAAQDALPTKDDAPWMAALEALAASDNFRSPIITRLCTTLGSIGSPSKPSNIKRKKQEDDQ
ncbi:hypothetical protein IWW47_004428, partial [Coemansia sp. RSA 2052]